MYRLIVSTLIILYLSFGGNIVIASEKKEFSSYMQGWTDNKDLASKLLKEAEDAFKNGDELSGCALQVKASKKGVEATESLIKAMEINGSIDGLDNLQVGLNKWRELGRLC